MYVRLPDDYKIGAISPERSPTTSTAELTADAADGSDSPPTESLLVQPPQQSESADVDTSLDLSQAMTQFQCCRVLDFVGVPMLQIGLNSWTGTEGSPVSCLICDRWQRLNLESHLAAVCAASGY